VASELKSLFYGRTGAPEIVSVIAGLGGRDVTVRDFKEMYRQAVSGSFPATL
jgi:pyruvate ferredoxin oxidoreductase alpha subunit